MKKVHRIDSTFEVLRVVLGIVIAYALCLVIIVMITGMEGANDAGRTRPERLERLRASFEAAGVSATLDQIPNVPHMGIKVMPAAQKFFAAVLRERRARQAQQ